MKKTLLIAFALVATLALQAKDWKWGTAEWNIADGTTFTSIEDFKDKGGVTLTFPNPNKVTLTFFHVLVVNYNIYVDDATEPIEWSSSAQQGTEVQMDYRFVEGHTYRLETTEENLCKADIATYSTDTLSTAHKVYTISFTIQGPEQVKNIDVEGTMALTIVDQNYYETFSPIDTKSICEALGISNINEATLYALNPNGSYCEEEWFGPSYFDGWRDADGAFTLWNGGYNRYDGHNAYPAVYCIKINATRDTIFYYFYDYWKEYKEDDPGEIPGTGAGAKRRAPATSYNSIVWDWDNGDGSFTKYTRNYRCDEGTDYKGGFIFIANKKSAVVNATLHFVSQEAFEEYYIATDVKTVPAATKQEEDGIYSINGTRLPALQKGFNIVRKAGEVKKVFVK